MTDLVFETRDVSGALHIGNVEAGERDVDLECITYRVVRTCTRTFEGSVMACL